MKAFFKTFFILLAVVVVYFSAWPVPIDPKSWEAPKAPELTGIYAVNTKLAEFEALDLDGLSGPEAVTEDAAGNIYATTHEGWILRWQKGSTKPERYINVSGRPLGIAFDAAQNLWVANAYEGLQRITPAGEITLELAETEGIAIGFADDLVVVPNGKVYLSDASTKFAAGDGAGTLAASLLDIMEHGDYGRIIEFDPATGESKVVMDGMTFANGVTAPANGEYILVAETGSYRIWKHWLQGPNVGKTIVLADNLPGFPDNIHLGLNGRYWLGFTTQRIPAMDRLSDKPFWRKVVQRMPEFLRPNVEAPNHVIAINSDGEVLYSLQDPKGAYPATTGAWETEEYLYVSSLTASVLARYNKAELGISD